VYCFAVVGSSIERTKTDLFEAYVMRSPWASLERGVGAPRVVVGDAAQMASVAVVQFIDRPYSSGFIIAVPAVIDIAWRNSVDDSAVVTRATTIEEAPTE
jgi:hypothetical protein